MSLFFARKTSAGPPLPVAPLNDQLRAPFGIYIALDQLRPVDKPALVTGQWISWIKSTGVSVVIRKRASLELRLSKLNLTQDWKQASNYTNRYNPNKSCPYR